MFELDATRLSGNRWAVRPIGCLGICGWKNNKPWSVLYVTAYYEKDAIRKAEALIHKALQK